MTMNERRLRFSDEKCWPLQFKQFDLFFFTNLNLAQALFVKTPHSNTFRRCFGVAFHDCTTSQRKGSQQKVHRRANHFREVAGVRDLLAQVGECAKRVN
jgi:hypothetical protein